MRRCLPVWLLLLVAMAVAVSAESAKYDVLIVTNGSDPLAHKIAHELRRVLEKHRADSGLTSRELPIDEYDISNPEHMAAVKRLGISKARLPFIGACTLGGSQGLPVKVLVGVGPINDIDEAIRSLVEQAGKRLGLKPTDLGTIPSHPPTGHPPAGSVVVQDAVMCKAVDDDYKPVNPTDVYRPTDAFFCSLFSPNLHPGVVLTGRWFKGDELLATKKFEPNIEGPAYFFFSYKPVDGPWSPGAAFHLKVQVEGETRKVMDFRVAGRVEDVTLCKNVDDNQLPVTPATTFGPAETVYCSVYITDTVPDQDVSITWSHDGTVLREAHYKLEANSSKWHVGFWAKPPDPAWPTGSSTVSVFVDGALAQKVPFRITGY